MPKKLIYHFYFNLLKQNQLINYHHNIIHFNYQLIE